MNKCRNCQNLEKLKNGYKCPYTNVRVYGEMGNEPIKVDCGHYNAKAKQKKLPIWL